MQCKQLRFGDVLVNKNKIMEKPQFNPQCIMHYQLIFEFFDFINYTPNINIKQFIFKYISNG